MSVARQPGASISHRSLGHLFVSQLVRRPVVAEGGRELGRLNDLVVRLEEPDHPTVSGVVVGAGKRDLFVPAAAIALASDVSRLRDARLAFDVFRRRDGEALLYREVVDRRVVDVQGARVARVNDAAVGELDGQWRLIGMDVSTRGLLRRLGPRRLVGGLASTLVDWLVVEPLAAEVPEARLRISHSKLVALHPVDIARVVDHLPNRHGAELIAALDDANAADALEEVEKGRQADILGELPEERAAGILNKMAGDAAADLLAHLPSGEVDQLIQDMDREASAKVRLLLSYPANSAGGLMTSDFVVALEHETTRQAVESMRAQLKKPDLIYYVYVVDDPDNQRLRGVVSLRDLLLAAPDQLLSIYMRRDIQAIHPEEKASEAARVMSEYNLLALPVVDETGRMLGLITADDVLDVLLPASLRRHTPRLFS
jgi:CBS domain-containing protein/sporulation protein YlmC with PRC-barrel domain